jgi:tetrahydromethanopterin S-methyltransferase subunit A
VLGVRLPPWRACRDRAGASVRAASLGALLANPHVRFLLVCGADSRKTIGHLPGQSLVALARNGLDADQPIVGARGKCPALRNIAHATGAHFRCSIEVLGLVRNGEVRDILEATRCCGARGPGAATPFAPERLLTPLAGHAADRMVPDPAGDFVINVDRRRGLLSLEHYRPDGLLDGIIEGKTAPETYTPALERGLLPRLDHAAYLVLARAEHALRSGDSYVQDGAPEAGGAPATCGGAAAATQPAERVPSPHTGRWAE